MWRALFASAVAGLISTPTLAADLAPAPIEVAPISSSFSWTGAYIGGHLGWGWDSADWTNTDFNGAFHWWGGPGVPNGATLEDNGFIGGAQIGYLYQFQNNLVFGADVSISGADISETIISPTAPAFDTWTTEIDYFVLAQAKLGWAQDKWLGFIQGGYAGANGKASAFGTFGGIQNPSETNWHNGWTIGAGFSYKWTDRFSFGVEYNYADLGDKNYNLPNGPPGDIDLVNVDHKLHVVKLTGNIHFGGP